MNKIGLGSSNYDLDHRMSPSLEELGDAFVDMFRLSSWMESAEMIADDPMGFVEDLSKSSGGCSVPLSTGQFIALFWCIVSGAAVEGSEPTGQP